MASTEVIIDAPIEVVWDIMTNVDKYPEWNPFIVSIDIVQPSEPSSSIIQEGTGITVNVIFPKDKESGKITTAMEKVSVLDPPNSSSSSSNDTNPGTKSARWEYGVANWMHSFNIVRATRIQQLTEIVTDGNSNNNNTKKMTKYYTEEVFHGFLNKFVPLQDVQEGFEAQAKALKAHAEQQ